MDDYKIALGALLDANAKGDIDKQLNAIKDLSVTISKATLSNDVINDIKRQLTQNGIDLKLVFGNVNQITNQAKQTGQQIGKLISDSAEQAISNVSSKNIGRYFRIDSSTSNQFRTEMEKLVSEWTNAKGKLTDLNIQTRTSYDKDADANITRLHQATVTYKNELDEVIKKTIAWRQIGTTTNSKGEEEILRGFVEVAGRYSKSLDTATVKIDNFVDKQKTAVTNLSNQLATIESKFNSSKKPLSDIYDIAQVENKMFDVRKAIDTLSTSSKTGFTDAKNAVTTEITELNNLITTLQNAEYAATSLRTKDIKTVKTDEENNLNTFVEKMKQSGHYTEKLEQDVASLRSQLSNVFDANTLTSYLNGLSNLQSEFKSVDTAAKTAEKATKIQTNVEAEKKILTLYKNELKEAGVLTGDVKQKIQDMFRSLSKVDSQNGLTTWRAELKGVKAETDAVLKSVQSSSTKEQDAYEVAYKELKKLYDLKIEYSKLGSNKETDFYYGKAIADQEKVWRQAYSKTSEPDNWNVQKRLELEREELVMQDKLAQAYGKVTDAKKLADQTNKIQLSMGANGNTTSQIEVLRNSFSKLGLSADEVKTKMNGVDTEFQQLKILMNNGAENSVILSQFDKLENSLKQTQNNLKQTRSEFNLLATAQQRLSLANDIEAWNQKNTAASKEVIAQNEKYIATLRNLDVAMTKIEKSDISTSFKKNENAMRSINKLGASLKDQLKDAASSFTQWISVSSAIMGIVYSTKEAVSEIKNLDNILTEISKTSDLTSQELEKLGMSAYSSGSRYGNSASDYLTAVQEMSRSGFYGDKGSAMAEQSLLARSAGDMSTELANKYVLATNAAFKFNGEASKINEVLDGQNSITNRNSVAMEDMATAMTEAGTVASSYNVSIENLSAMIGTIESVTKLGGSEDGTGIKSILINLQNISSDKITQTLEEANASMTKMVNGTKKLRDPITILKDLAKTFNELDQDDPLRAKILTNVGGRFCLVI